ncbi:hypothetical protein BC351_10305 [Paenibacillus ferrarius]|uniref:Uncharacterized protein n=1 Tax=Paenibacillus ferrarius TaxID=1469647 RepID=A0A1V4H8N5_9BACL|nr:hypothetical protein [Paenibacillus ferrarius]OPH47575.1 hypothetical protein BC351_10305 [Paenibacillus ferrarius]
MANEPSVSWYEYVSEIDAAQGTRPLSMWQLNTVEADGNSDLTLKKFIIWNNKSGTQAAQTMRNCTIGTRDTSGGFNQPLVKERWVKGHFPVGANPFAIGAVDNAGVLTAVEMPIKAASSAAATGTVEGNINDGNMATAGNDKNYSIFQLRMVVPASSGAGLVQAKLRVGYEITG